MFRVGEYKRLYHCDLLCSHHCFPGTIETAKPLWEGKSNSKMGGVPLKTCLCFQIHLYLRKLRSLHQKHPVKGLVMWLANEGHWESKTGPALGKWTQKDSLGLAGWPTSPAKLTNYRFSERLDKVNNKDKVNNWIK